MLIPTTGLCTLEQNETTKLTRRMVSKLRIEVFMIMLFSVKINSVKGSSAIGRLSLLQEDTIKVSNSVVKIKGKCSIIPALHSIFFRDEP